MKTLNDCLIEDMKLIGMSEEEIAHAFANEAIHCDLKIQMYKAWLHAAVQEGMRRAANIVACRPNTMTMNEVSQFINSSATALSKDEIK